MFQLISIQHRANIENTRYGQVFINPTIDQMKGIRNQMARYLAGLKGVTEAARPLFCSFRVLNDGNDIYGWLDPPVEATHSQMIRELELGITRLADSGSGIRISDFDKYGYDIRTLFQKTVGDWSG